jgi:NAD+ synthase (glutamine-hydrolysing)
VKWAADSGVFGEDASSILKDILATPVSPELLPPVDGNISQITEKTVGPYELVDFFLYHMVKNHLTPDKIAFLAENAFENDYSPETIRHWLDIFIKRFISGQPKRISMSEGPAVLGVSLSPRGGFNMPGDVAATAYTGCR